MKKRLFMILAALVLMLAAASLTREATADGTYASGWEAWLQQAKEEAAKADYVIGGDDGINQKHGLTIIMPGETVAVIPDFGVNHDGIQGHITAQYNTIIQLNEPEVHTDYLKTSKPKKMAFTEVQKRVLPYFYGDRDIFKDDNVLIVEGASSAEYVSLYRNDTGLPVILRGQHWQSGRYMTTKSVKGPAGIGKHNEFRTNYQAATTYNYAPVMWFAEPSYNVNLWTKTSAGKAYEWRRDDYQTTYKVYVDAKDHTYKFDNPVVEEWCFSTWEEKTVASSAFPVKDNGTIANGRSQFTWNMQAQMDKNGDMSPEHFLSDHELAASFLMEGRTIRFDANGGTINGKKTLLAESGHDDVYTVSPKNYQPVRDGYAFLGWCTDKDNAEETLLQDATAENSKDWFTGKHMVLYAAWKLESTAKLSSVKFSADTAEVKENAGITAVTNTSAVKLTMYAGGKAAKTWTKGYTDKDGKRTWKVTYAFAGAGTRTLEFRAADADGKYTPAKTAKITITETPKLTSVKFGKATATVNQKVTITAVTNASAAKLTLYSGTKAIQSWTKGYTDNGNTRTWKVTYAFSGAGERTVDFRAADAKGVQTAAKSATITITKAPTLSSVKFAKARATVNQKVTVTAVTNTTARKLTLYSGGKAIQSWTKGYTDKSGKRTWKVSYAFSGAGERTVDFKAADANGVLTEAKSATITITKAPALSSVKFSKDQAKVNEEITITAVTNTTTTKLTMYAGTKAVKSWTEGYTDKSGKRTWKVKYAFSGKGERTLDFKGFDANGVGTAAKTATIKITK